MQVQSNSATTTSCLQVVFKLSSSYLISTVGVFHLPFDIWGWDRKVNFVVWWSPATHWRCYMASWSRSVGVFLVMFLFVQRCSFFPSSRNMCWTSGSRFCLFFRAILGYANVAFLESQYFRTAPHLRCFRGSPQPMSIIIEERTGQYWIVWHVGIKNIRSAKITKYDHTITILLPYTITILLPLPYYFTHINHIITYYFNIKPPYFSTAELPFFARSWARQRGCATGRQTHGTAGGCAGHGRNHVVHLPGDDEGGEKMKVPQQLGRMLVGEYGENNPVLFFLKKTLKISEV